jgi:hypothetical protein
MTIISKSSLKRAVLRPGVFNGVTANPELRSQITLHLGIDLGIERNSEMKELHPILLTQGYIEHCCFSEGERAKFPA